MAKQTILAIIISIVFTAIMMGPGMDMYRDTITIATVQSSLSDLDSAAAGRLAGELVTVQSKTNTVTLPNFYSSSLTPTDMTTAKPLPGTDLTIQASATNDKITFGGQLNGTVAANPRFLCKSASVPAAGVIEIPGYTNKGQLPQIFQKNTDEYLKDGIVGILGLHSNYAYEDVMKLSNADLQLLVKAIFDPPAGKDPLIGIVHPNVYELRNGYLINNKVTKESCGKLFEIAYVNSSKTAIETPLATVPGLTGKTDTIYALTEAIMQIKTGFIFMPDSKFPIDRDTNVPVVRAAFK